MSMVEKSKILINEAREAQKFARAKYSNFSVGAALESANGEIVRGCNVESSSYGISICAERVGGGFGRRVQCSSAY